MSETLLGIPIDTASINDITRATKLMLRKKTRDHVLWIVTANPELFVHARRDPILRETLQQTDVIVPDGIGIVLALLLLRRHRLHRVTGIELLSHLIATIDSREFFFFGGHESIVKTAAEQLDIPNWHHGYGSNLDDPGATDATGAIIAINRSNARILCVGLGSPKQEHWIAEHRNDFEQVRVVIGVGGIFDILAGALPRAPRFLRRCGLEWLWRLYIEPQRIKRAWNAVVIFPYPVSRYRTHAT